jgi:hypothetical protein
MADKENAPAGPAGFPVGIYDKLYLAAEDVHADAGAGGKGWKVLVVDDEAEVHAVTKLALGDFSFASSPLVFLDA